MLFLPLPQQMVIVRENEIKPLLRLFKTIPPLPFHLPRLIRLSFFPFPPGSVRCSLSRLIGNTKIRSDLLRSLFVADAEDGRDKIDYIPVGLTCKTVVSSVQLHARVSVVVKDAAGHSITFNFYSVKLCRPSGGHLFLHCFKQFHPPSFSFPISKKSCMPNRLSI